MDVVIGVSGNLYKQEPLGRIRKKRNAYKLLVGKPEGNKLVRRIYRGEDIIKMEPRER
jgi:hypothetical protein